MSSGAAQKQSSRELASAGATTRVQNAAVQVGSLRPAFSQHARRRSQHLQSSTPSRSTLDAPDLSSRGSEPMAGCRRSRVIAPSALASFCSPQIKLTTPPKPIREIAWKAQLGTCMRYRKLARSGKPAKVVTAAIARELAGFIWATAQRGRRRRAERTKPVIAAQGGASEPLDMLLPGKAGGTAAVRRTLATTICRIADPTLVARPRQLHDASTVMRFQPAHQSMINRRHDGRASCLARQSLQEMLETKPRIYLPATCKGGHESGKIAIAVVNSMDLNRDLRR